MSRIELLPIGRDEWQQIAENAEEFGSRRCLSVAAARGELQAIASTMVDFLERVNAHGPWTSYLAVSVDDRLVVGTCSFKSPPNADGEVEIAYYTFPAFEGRGVGSAMAAGLADTALAAGIRRILAHTLPAPGPSTRILEKNGFHCVGSIVDPEDGPVWRWERDRAED